MRGIGLVCFTCLLVAACSSSNADKESGGSDAGRVHDINTVEPIPPGPVKIDLLIVMDASTSMAQEQAAIVKAFPDFIELLGQDVEVDLRVAVVSMNSIGDKGVFQNSPAQSFPPAASERRIYPCLGNSDCSIEFGSGWLCEYPPGKQMYTFNGSITTKCAYSCSSDSQCCENFCPDNACSTDSESFCAYVCDDGPDECIPVPDTLDCPADLPTFVEGELIPDIFPCLALVEITQSFAANLEQGLKAAWMGLNPNGINEQQAKGFIRDDAYLLLLFITDEDDCSIDEQFCSPSFDCETPSDEEKCEEQGGKCKTDLFLTELYGKQKRLCCGTIKKDYYSVCGLLEDYLGPYHHLAAYDLKVSDCETDSDCPENWHCKEGGAELEKCRPYIYSFKHFASYQQPPGTPLFALGSVDKYYEQFRSLKSNPDMVLVGALAGDGIVHSDDSEALVSDACLGNSSEPKEQAIAAKLDKCISYKAAKEQDMSGCDADPAKAGCEEFLAIKLECIRQCYIASKGAIADPPTARNSYICKSHTGSAEPGTRYLKLVEKFGSRGFARDICSPDTFDNFAVELSGFVGNVLQADRGPCGFCPGEQSKCMGSKCVCEPDCAGRECGSDGCDGTCGDGPAGGCPDGHHCLSDNTCCQQACDGKQCGPDGCGGFCGDGPEQGCAAGELCKDDFSCCAPACDGHECGPDGCGGSCGVCRDSQEMCMDGLCVCMPYCDGRECGPDGCGGICGTCPEGEKCSEQQLCMACASHNHHGCYDDDVYWLDSCGTVEEMAFDCDDGNPCTIDECINGQCEWKITTTGCCTLDQDCMDCVNIGTGDWCKADYAVFPPQCVGENCVDNVCTVHQCEYGFCYYSSVPGCVLTDADCDDSDPCTLDFSDENYQCQHTGEAGCCTQDGTCDDQDDCTTDFCDVAPGEAKGTCEHEEKPDCCAVPDDCPEKPCMEVYCQSATCIYVEIENCCVHDEECDDADICTIDKCKDNVCVHFPSGICP